jgi:hypothetical protein
MSNVEYTNLIKKCKECNINAKVDIINNLIQRGTDYNWFINNLECLE